jgi:hypothetical protein
MATLSGKAQEEWKCTEAHARADTTTTYPHTVHLHTFDVPYTCTHQSPTPLKGAMSERERLEQQPPKPHKHVDQTLVYVPGFIWRHKEHRLREGSIVLRINLDGLAVGNRRMYGHYKREQC